MKFLALFLALASLTHAAAPEELRYRAEVLAEGMPQPIEFQIAPDGRVFWIEIAGKVRLLDPKTGHIAEVGALEVFNAQENGLIGMALDPQFAQNHWMYLLHSPKDFEGQHLSRFTITDDKLDPASEKILLTYPEQRRECCHHAGCLEFGPDGCLFIAAGDNTNPGGETQGYAPIDEQPDHFPRDAQKSASNTNDLRGKILRIKPKPDGTYEIPKGNLFPPGTPLTRPEIYVMGCRNPWRCSVDQKTGILYWGEVGPDSYNDGPLGPRGYDEINQARTAGNFGWPYFVGDNFAYNKVDFATRKISPKWDVNDPVNDSPNNTGMKHLPKPQPAFMYWPYADSPEFPELGKGGRTACSGAVFHFEESFKNTSGFPPEYDHCLIFFDWQRSFIKWARLDKDEHLVKIEPFHTPVKIQRPTMAKFDREGRLYILDYGETWGANKDSQLIRLSYQWGNLAPIVKAEVKPMAGKAPLTVTLSSEGTFDPEGEALTYEWRLLPGGKVLSTEANARVTLSEPGDTRIELRVTDPHQAVSATTRTVVVGNDPPLVVLEEPRNGDFFTPGKPVAYRVHVTDAEDGDSAKTPDMMGFKVLVTGTLDDGGAVEPALAMMKASDCFNCHQVEQKLVGPAYLDVADKYRNDPAALEASSQRVMKGSVGVWGPIPMLPHATHTADEIHQMVHWVFSLKRGETTTSFARGLAGSLTPPKGKDGKGYVLDATFTDNGKAPASPLTGHASVTLRSRKIQAVQADEIHGPQVLGKVVGAIADKHYLKLARINLTDIGAVSWHVASGGVGGKIELRASSPDGPLLAEDEVKPTGGWSKFEDHRSAFSKVCTDDRADLFVVFKNPGKGGLMNLEWLRFESK